MSRDDQTNNNGEGDDTSREQSWDQSWQNLNKDSQYGPTSHPEDAPGGFQGNGQGNSRGNAQGNGQGYGPGNDQGSASGYGGYGQPYPQTPYQNSYQGYGATSPQNDVALEASNGKVDIMRAIRFGFKATFANPAVWILGTVGLGLAFMIVSGLLGYLSFLIDPNAGTTTSGFSVSETLLNVVIGIITFAITICVMRGALLSVDGHKVRFGDFFKPINVGQTVILMVGLGIFGIILGTFTTFLTQNLVSFNDAAGTVEVNNSGLGMFFIVYLLLFFINPLYSYWVYYAADGHHTAGSAVQTGFKDSLRNYPMLLLFSLVGGFATLIIGIFTIGFGLIIVLPVMMLSTVHIYRQISGGNIPVERR